MDVPNNDNLGQNYWSSKDESNNLASNHLLFQERRMDPPSQNNDYRYLRDEFGNLFKVYLPQNTQNSRANEYELFNKDSHHNLPNYGLAENFHANSPPLGTLQHEYVNSQTLQVPPLTQTTKTNMFINQLVGNWTPNLSGTYSPFGETVNSPPSNQLPMPSFQDNTGSATAIVNNRTLILNNNLENNFNPNLAPGLIEKETVEKSGRSAVVNVTAARKTRIVAEVKPMRMSYSDVLSKNVINDSQIMDGSTNIVSPAGTGGKNNKQSSDKLKYANLDKKVNCISENENELGATKIKKSASSVQTYGATIKNTSIGGKLEGSANSGGEGAKKINFIKKKASKVKTRSDNGQSGKKSAHEYIFNDSKSSQKEDDDSNSDAEQYPEGVSEYYNIRKNFQNTDGQHHNIEKISTAKGQPSYKKTKSATACSLLSRSKLDKGQKRTAKSNNTSNSRKREKHEILLKIFHTWFLYLLKFTKWLYDVVFDVIYLSFGIIYDRSFLGYQLARQAFNVVHQDVRENSGLWVKNLWKKFDGKFEKKSKWAFWRYIFKKKLIPSEQFKDYYKDGKLPTTADEAMKSLLNCKGKDAYSILGVSPNCSQEQIRKHYKKIAVLVHPDKNKQAGAEEAFKILQRSFELVGEAETRKNYEKKRYESVIEASRSEKAWSELNDLLVQLQTKISEAANTIRCSSCCLRHPRKPTGRKPFAARECSTCKIRHPAREGDIWAETTFFGIRWKYLALMEGNVFDITDWANCQKGALSHLQPNSCLVQYKIVLGGNSQSHQQQSQHHQQQTNIQLDREKKKEPNTNEANLDDFLNNIYAGQNQPPLHTHHQRRRYKKN